ncbi:MAG: SsrA-binding protein SmpB [Candidatus Nomurabacteria bacterium]|jgi:SsrA-binding protein|nr:SsrA-binding protein SmpB [Candidatus Nomurabacteria bacterium]
MPKTKHKPAKKPTVVDNRRAHFDYTLSENLTAGLVLSGKQVRAVRDNRVQLKGAYVVVRNGELWLQNASFSLKNGGHDGESVIDTSPIKLLVKKKQLQELASARTAGYTIVPTKLFAARRFVKVEIALGKGKKSYDKRETIKRRDSDREARRAIKGAR